ncbi:MMPL family transporter [Shewanella aestuarii]|uniref:MMPL family transporter n=1 Tax=Shewanella aestuarii TaxID=1028752 RepID=A0A6G9QK79_9GAMM|nr:MMPL family transporter [Shewanella aestuarii]QIR14970.1 MMPL family transporter [Shewanella aestuarii]
MKHSLFSKHHLPFILSLILIGLVTYLAVIYSKNNFVVDSDLDGLVKQDAPWKDNLQKTTNEFGQSENSLVIVISGENRHEVQSVTEQLHADFTAEPLFSDVFSPTTLPWFKQQALWFLADDEFTSFNDNLVNLMPKLQAALSLQAKGADVAAMQLLAQLNHALQIDDETSAKLLIKAINQVASEKANVDWFEVLLPESTDTSYQIISINAKPQLDQKEPNRLIIETAQTIISQYNQNHHHDVQIRITGQTALDFDEISDANNSVKLAGTMSLIGLIVVLGFGIRSLRIILASYVAVIIGLVWTLALGLLLVGSYNTISIVFLVMFIGLGVDFAIHFCLRLREEQVLHDTNLASLFASIRGTLLPLSLCAITSAIGFLGFYPTAYTGLAELGIISAAGMVMGLLATFTVIPSFFYVFGYPKKLIVNGINTELNVPMDDADFWLPKHHKLVVFMAVVALVISGYGASKMEFDFSTLVLKSVKSESVKTLEEIQQQGLTSSYQMMMLATSPAEAANWQSQLLTLPEVSNVVSINSFLPQGRSEKLAALLAALNASPAPIMTLDNLTTLQQNLIASPLAQQGLEPQTIRWLQQNEQSVLISQINQTALLPLQQMYLGLNQLMQAPEATYADIPKALAQRYQNDEYLLVVAYPAGDMRDVKQLDRFIQAVQAIAPDATGRPVAEQQVGQIIIKAFFQAVSYSLLLIGLILLIALKHKRDVLLTFIPLLLTTLSTMAVAHWSGQALNMANIIVIPLIFGLGVDNGIHIVERFRSVGSARAFYRSSTPRAAILSSLTTMATFGSLLLADHRGMYSIGFLLTIAIGFLLFYSLTVLPALLFSVKKGQS